MALPSFAYAANGSEHPFRWPFAISLAVHLALMGLLIYTPLWDRSPSYLPSVIDVQMVDLTDLAPAPSTSTDSSKEEAAPVVEPPKEKAETAPVVQETSKAKPEISVAPPRKKTKTSLKKKTFKSKKVIKNALQRVERKVDTLPPKPLEDTIKRLRDKVAKEGKPTPQTGVKTEAEGQGKSGKFFARGSRKESELIDLYMVEVAFTIQKNWAFSSQMAGDSSKLLCVVEFKVLPNGQISDIYIIDRSGNQYLDDSALKAIQKSSPVDPHPEKLSMPYVHMGINFGPEGVR